MTLPELADTRLHVRARSAPAFWRKRSSMRAGLVEPRYMPQ